MGNPRSKRDILLEAVIHFIEFGEVPDQLSSALEAVGVTQKEVTDALERILAGCDPE